VIPANEWWAIIQNYSESVYPAQILFYLLIVVALAVFLRQPGKIANRVVKGLLALVFGWIGLIFFLIRGQGLPAHNAQAFLFLSLSVCFLIDLLTDNTQFLLHPSGWRRTVTLIGFGLVMLVYPLTGFLLGHPASRWIIPGTFPCPTTALALIFMVTTFPDRLRWLYLVTLCLLLVWAIPFPIMIQIPQFGVYEDGIMLATGIYALILLPINWKKSRTHSLNQ